jgi:hypothetical protein
MKGLRILPYVMKKMILLRKFLSSGIGRLLERYVGTEASEDLLPPSLG